MDSNHPKIGLVLEGGAMRGMYTAGVLDVLMDEGFTANMIVGVSAGALFGVNFASRQRGRAIRYNKRFNKDSSYMGIKPLIREGNIISPRYAYSEVPRNLDPFDDEAFKESGVPFYAVVTNIKTGLPEYVRIESVFDQMDLLRASGSMPFVSQPVPYRGNTYLDGGIADSIPFQWASEHGCDKPVVIVTQDASYRKSPMNSFIINRYKKKYPEIAKRLSQRHIQYNESLDLLNQWEAEGRAFVFRPSEPIHIGRLERDPSKMQSVYDLGIKDARSKMKDLIAYL